MKDFPKGKIIVLLIAILSVSGVCLISSAYVKGSTMPFTQIIGVVTTPFKKGISLVQNVFSDVGKYFGDIDAVYAENEELKNKVAEMEQRIRDGELAVLENEQLRELLGMKQKNRSFEFEMAEIVGVSSGEWDLSFTIDKGTLCGIKVNDCVICSEGMIGYVTETGLTFSIIKIITDPQTAIGAIVSRSRAIGVAEGSYELMYDGKIKLAYLEKDADILVGDSIETSGASGIFPKGIIIGTVESIQTEPHGMCNYAIIKTSMDLKSIKRVFVITDFEIEE